MVFVFDNDFLIFSSLALIKKRKKISIYFKLLLIFVLS